MAFSGVTVVASGQVIPAFPGKRVRITGLVLVANTPISVKFQSASTDITGNFPLAANSGFVMPYNPAGWFDTTPSEALNIVLSAGTTTAMQLTYETV
jgi:hypothetical protein